MMTRKKTPKPKPRSHIKKAGRPLLGPLHPWRLCPTGQHRVRAHARQGTKGVSSHCRDNPSHRDQIYEHEMNRIAEEFFAALTGPPAANTLDFKEYKNEFDPFVRGWTKYWNEIFQPKELGTL